MVNNQDPYGQIDNDETEQACFENVDQNEDCNSETNENHALPNHMPPQLSDESISDMIKTLNVKQRQIFDIVHKWARDFVKSLSTKGNFAVEPFYIFLSGSGGTGKSHVIKTIYQAITKTLLYHATNPEKPRVLLLGPTGIAAININGTTVHSGLGIFTEGNYNNLVTSIKHVYEINYQKLG